MAKPPRKSLSRCPDCGHEQPEPRELISTFCRACGNFYQTARAIPAVPVEPPVPPLPPGDRQTRRPVACHRCGTSHPVSTAARNTICPGCSTCIDLQDLSILSPSSQPLDTRGRLFIGTEGSLSNSWMVCGSARIEGTVRGVLRSEGPVVLATPQPCHIQLIAPSVVVERNATIRLTGPLETGSLVVRGRFSGTVNCRGTIHVARGGCLEADIFARSIIVEKGGLFRGGCQVISRRDEEDPKEEPRRYPFFMLRPSPTY